MENTIGIQVSFARQIECRRVQTNDCARAKSVKHLSILDWYRILRAHYHWPLFQAIRYALWLAR